MYAWSWTGGHTARGYSVRIGGVTPSMDPATKILVECPPSSMRLGKFWWSDTPRVPPSLSMKKTHLSNVKTSAVSSVFKSSMGTVTLSCSAIHHCRLRGKRRPMLIVWLRDDYPSEKFLDRGDCKTMQDAANPRSFPETSCTVAHATVTLTGEALSVRVHRGVVNQLCYLWVKRNGCRP